jgi:excisionase family DNA binding protein
MAPTKPRTPPKPYRGTKRPPPERIVLTIPEVMDTTGLSREFVYKQVRTRQLRSMKVGRRRLVRIADLEAWLDAFTDTGDDTDTAAEG